MWQTVWGIAAGKIVKDQTMFVGVVAHGAGVGNKMSQLPNSLNPHLNVMCNIATIQQSTLKVVRPTRSLNLNQAHQQM